MVVVARCPTVEYVLRSCELSSRPSQAHTAALGATFCHLGHASCTLAAGGPLVPCPDERVATRPDPTGLQRNLTCLERRRRHQGATERADVSRGGCALHRRWLFGRCA